STAIWSARWTAPAIAGWTQGATSARGGGGAMQTATSSWPSDARCWGGARREGGGGRDAAGDEQLAERRQVLVGRAAGERGVEHAPERPQVGAMVDVAAALHLLGGHVERRPEDATGRGQRRVREAERVGANLGDAEVEQLDGDRAVGASR